MKTLETMSRMVLLAAFAASLLFGIFSGEAGLIRIESSTL